jgi:hypothetical protein
LNEQATLREVFENDPSADVRHAAFERITDQAVLAQIAKREGEFAPRAAERLSEQKWLGEIARSAASPKVRAAVVARLDDDELLQRIASLDVDPEVRLRAKLRHDGPDRFRDYLKRTLSKLDVAHRKADRVAEFCGTLDDVCGALVAHSRYRINGVVADLAEPTISSASDFSCVELIAGRRDANEITAHDRVERVVYRIKIWRQGENDFSGAVEERRYEMSSNAVAWSDSSKSD